MKAQALLQGKRSNISQWHVGCFHIHSYRQQHIYCIVCNRICLIPYIWFLIRILDCGKCNPYGTAKAGERFAKDLRKGVSWELLFSTTFKSTLQDKDIQFQFLRLYQVASHCPKVTHPTKKNNASHFFWAKMARDNARGQNAINRTNHCLRTCPRKTGWWSGGVAGCHWMFFCVSSLAKGDDEEQKKKII